MRGKSLPIGSISGNKSVQLYSEDGGLTCTGFGMGSLLEREEVDKKLPAIREECGIETEQDTRVLGLACRSGADNISGAVGIDFHPPLSMETAVRFAACLTRESVVVDFNIYASNVETGIRYGVSLIRVVSPQ